MIYCRALDNEIEIDGELRRIETLQTAGFVFNPEKRKRGRPRKPQRISTPPVRRSKLSKLADQYRPKAVSE